MKYMYIDYIVSIVGYYCTRANTFGHIDLDLSINRLICRNTHGGRPVLSVRIRYTCLNYSVFVEHDETCMCCLT